MQMIGHLLKDSLVWKRATRTADGAGGHTQSFTAVATVRGRVSQASQRDLDIAGKSRAEVTHAIYLPAGTAVKVADRFVWSSRTFEVKVPNITPSVAVYTKALTLEIQEG